MAGIGRQHRRYLMLLLSVLATGLLFYPAGRFQACHGKAIACGVAASGKYMAVAHAGEGAAAARAAALDDFHRFLECTRGGERHWCATTSACLPPGRTVCPDDPASPTCRRPLLFRLTNTGISNQKLRWRNMAAMAAAGQMALLLDRVAYYTPKRDVLGTDETANRWTGVSYMTGNMSDAFDVSAMLAAMRQHACVFVIPPAPTSEQPDWPAHLHIRVPQLPGIPMANALLVHTYQAYHTAEEYRALAAQWRAQGRDLVVPDDSFYTYATSSPADTSRFDDLLLAYPPRRLIADHARAIISALVQQAVAGRAGTPGYYAVHLRTEADTPKEWLAAMPPPARLVQLMQRAGVQPGSVVYIAGGYSTVEREVASNAYVRAMCNGTTGWRCAMRSNFTAALQRLPAELASFDLAALTDYEVLVSHRALLLYGSLPSSLSAIAVAARERRGLLSTYVERTVGPCVRRRELVPLKHFQLEVAIC
jgi:hypothetical protein